MKSITLLIDIDEGSVTVNNDSLDEKEKSSSGS